MLLAVVSSQRAEVRCGMCMRTVLLADTARASLRAAMRGGKWRHEQTQCMAEDMPIC